MSGNKEIWEKEWSSTEMMTVPNHAKDIPSDEVVLFRDYLKSLNINPPKDIVDIGSGKGRNAIYMAREGFNIYGIEYVSVAVEHAKNEALRMGVQNLTHFNLGDVTERWKFDNGSFDLAIDSLTAVGLHEEERQKCRDEMFRTLKEGGIALIRVVSSEDEFEKELMKKCPGSEQNSSLWPETNKFQKNFSEDELRPFYKKFNILLLKEHKKNAFKAGRDFLATNWWLILQKP